MDAEQSPIIRVRALMRRFGADAVIDGLDLDIEPGSIYGFIGPSGAGKTTVVRMLTGIDEPSSGELEVLGRTLDDFDGRLRARIGYLPQETVQFPNLSVYENLTFVASLYGLPIRRRARIDEVLRRTELLAHRRKPVRALSGGMKRRLALSAALLHDPELLFLDEPTAGIDPMLRRSLWEHLIELRDEGRTLFVTTQYVDEAAYCDRVGVLAHGRVVAEGTPDELRRAAAGGDPIVMEPSVPFDEVTARRLGEVDGVIEVARMDAGALLRLVVDDAAERLPDVQEWCAANELQVDALREEQLSFDEVFTILVQRAADDVTRPAATEVGA